MEGVHTLRQPEEVAFAEIVQAALDVLQSSQLPTTLPVKLDLEDDLPLLVLERIPMTHLLAGLLTHALSATAQNHVIVEVRCLHGRGGIGQGDWLWVSVRGAAHSFLAIDAGFPGAIPWAECQEIVMRHRGRIWIAGAASSSASSDSSAAVFMLPVWAV